MKKFLSYIVLTIVLFSLSIQPLYAIVDPLASPNNKYGIHILTEVDIPYASSLVNSNGGEWGYVTLVIREDERNTEQWQRFFNQLRDQKLIPIVRIATQQGPGYWEKPKTDDIKSWVYFLNTLNWVTQNRYIIIGNEPNHAKEWGGKISPDEYTDYFVEFSKELKAASPDFFVLPAGLDVSAPDDSSHMSASQYIKWMVARNSDVFNYADGWNSHSYPNPAFSGDSKDTGRGTIRSYEWELQYLKELGVKKELPVFITETGWAHDKEGNVLAYKDQSQVAEQMVQAYTEVWNDPKIVAITPFVLNYLSPPFDVFSWRKSDGSYYDFYYAVRGLPKVKGEPRQIDRFELISEVLPPLATLNDEAIGLALIRNKGQAVWIRQGRRTIVQDDVTYEIIPTNPLFDIIPGMDVLAGIIRK